MERLIYTNANGQSIIMSQNFPVFLKSFKGTGDLSFDVQQDKAPYQDGTTYLDSIADKRDIAIQLVIITNTQQELYEQRRLLGGIFNPKMGKGILRYENGIISKDIEVYLEAAPRYPVGDDNKGALFQNVLINLVAVQPFWMDILPTNEILSKIIPLFSFELQIPSSGIEFGTYSEGQIEINNDGDVSAPLRFEFRGPVTDPRIENVTTGAFIELITPLLANERMIITTDFGNKRAEIHKDDGTVINAFQYINLESTFFQLQQGINQLSFDASAGSTEATIEIQFKKRFIGV